MGRQAAHGPTASGVLGVLAGILIGLAPGAAVATPSPAGAGTAMVDTVPPADTATHADTASAQDTVPATGPRPAGTDTSTAADTTARPEAPAFPAALELPDSLRTVSVRSWSREELIAAAPQNLLDFLERQMPGLMGLSAGYFAGPFVAMDGAYGPGFVAVIVDGRELDPLGGGMVDLRRISLISVDRLSVAREAGSVRIEVTTVSHGEGPAYSRLEAATGRPSLNSVRGVFANGIGAHLQMAGAGDFLDVAGGLTPAHRLDGWARVAWMPTGGRVGFEVRGRSESIERTILGQEKFSRGELFLHGRADLTGWLQADGWAGRSTRRPDASTGGIEISDRQAALTLTALPGPASVRAAFRAWSGPSRPRMEGSLEAGVALNRWLRLEAGGDWTSWADFDAHTERLGVLVHPHTGGAIGLSLRGSVASGSRGVARPLQGTADSVGFDAFEGVADLRLGPYRLEGRGTWQKVSRQLPFGFAFDSALAPAAGATVGGFESRVEGPALPVGVLSDRLTFVGVWRHSNRLAGAGLRYVPADVAYGEIALRGDLFQDNLHILMAFGGSYRSAMATSRPGQAGVVLLPARSLALGRVEIRIDRFRLYWEGHDLGLVNSADFEGLVHQGGVNVVGVSWEWSN
jgi:hypothetical protein